MTSKQEKLAAARKRLKEFQGKTKEVEISKQKIITDVLVPKISKEDFCLTQSNGKSSPLVNINENSKNYGSGIQWYQVMQPVYGTEPLQDDCEKEAPGSLLSKRKFAKLLPENNLKENLVSGYEGNTHTGEKCDILVSASGNGLEMGFLECVGKVSNEIGNCSSTLLKDESLGPSESDHGGNNRSFFQNDNINLAWSEPKKFFDSDFNNKSALRETITSLQKELRSHVQTIEILIQQRNDAQTALTETENLLSNKSGEAAGLGQQVAHLTSSINGLTHRLFEAETALQKLNIEKEENFQKWYETRLVSDNIQAQLAVKEEELQEMKKKYEEKSSDCQQLLANLQEAQGQLSLYQIQLQQYSNEGHLGSAVQVSELQIENVNLKKKIDELKKELEAESAEKEESSQQFHIYAQQCNSQLSSLNSELKALKLEKEKLSKENVMLSENLSELEGAKEKTPCQSHEVEIADLLNQMSVLSEENKKLSDDLQKKLEKCMHLESVMDEKESELNKLFVVVNELSEENRKLASEAETPKANERLLATMESDKIAAAKAVSQNQRLKNQIIELEQAFIKLSEEKLELTNQLARERHVNGELQNLLKNAEFENHDHHHRGCHHRDEESEPLVNDSNEIEELRSIIRQLQDDKMELTARLNSYESNKNGDVKAREKEKGVEEDGKEEENGKQCENTKVLLQQMKEKVRKTMNEIAVLDEEKEKLEHLVLQLQGETETIGEYITLYQKQRMLLRQRAQEKDNQLLELSKDKEELKSKLAALDELVQCLLAERENMSILPESKLPDVNSSVKKSENTAGKIRALINEIGSTTLINNQSIAFEHCSCCSGRLITI